jgi:hypothetical protein
MKNIGGDDGNFGNFTICLLDDGSFFLVPFCETGRWFADGPRRWAQGGCTDPEPDIAFALDGDVASGKLKGFIHEFSVDASFVLGAWYQKATRVAELNTLMRPKTGLSRTAPPARNRLISEPWPPMNLATP